MRLICPNCDARYDVDASMIPASGRDVQCSNCGRTWFQEPASAAPEPALAVAEADEAVREEPRAERVPLSGTGLDDEAAAFFEGRSSGVSEQYEDEPEAATPVAESAPEDFEAEVEEPIAEFPEPDEALSETAESDETAAESTDTGESEGAAEQDSTPEEEVAVESASEQDEEAEDESPVLTDARESGPEEDSYDDEDDESGPPPPSRERQPVDAGVLGILRAEAEREIAQRRAEQAGLVETQPDLGLAEPTRAIDGDDVGARTARLRGDDDTPPPELEPRQKEVLPDIEDINASLTATSDRPPEEAPPVPVDQVLKRRAGFRVGFAAVMLIVVGLIVTYVNAPEIARAVPSLEPALASYVDWANSMRLGLDGFLINSIDRVTSIASDK